MSTGSAHRPHSIAAASLGLVLPVLLVLALVVVIVPVPPAVLDLLLAANLTASVLLLLTTMFVGRPVDFSAFPSLLLLSTLARLVLNIASTRLVLTRAATHGTSAAGDVIHRFAAFVAQDQILVGLILFAIVVVVQVIVVTKGATRLSEVAARFALDGMPGRQMAIDADLNAGVITAEEARRRRADITAQADFYAAMDGAGKFVRGDAMAGVVIILVNLIGGILIGVIQHRMSPQRAVEVFTLLTIGDGLVTQIPSFLIGLSAALLATRSSSQSNLSQDVIGQTFREPAVLFLSAGAAVALAFTGLPLLPLLGLGAGCLIAGEVVRRQRLNPLNEQAQHGLQSPTQNSGIATTSHSPVLATAAAKATPRPEDRLAIEPIELELGVRLIRLTQPQSGGDLMDRIGQLRHRIAQELGILLPKVKIRDNLRLKERGYTIRLRGVPVASGEIHTDRVLAVRTELVSDSVPGVDAIDPVSGHEATWIEQAQAASARELGYRIVDPAQVLMGHLNEIVRSHADELLSREHVHQLLDNLRQSAPRLIDELVPTLLKPSQIHVVLANLLRERVPVRDLETILETLGNYAERTKDTTILTEYVRHALSRVICQSYRDSRGVIHAITLDPALEDALSSGFEFSESGPIVRLTPQVTEGVSQELARQVQKLTRQGLPAIVVTGPRTRAVLRHLSAATLPKVAILSLNEIPRDTSVRSAGQVPLNAIKVPVTVDPIRRRMNAAINEFATPALS